MPRSLRRSAPLAALAAAVLALAGCGSGGTGVVAGKVTVNGKPLKKGLITFSSEVGNRDAFSAAIKDGLYKTGEIPCGLAKVTALNADRRLARLLGVHPGDALIRMDQVERTADGRPVLFSSEHYVPQILDLTVRRTRDARRRQISVAAGHPEPAAGGPMN